MEMDTGDEGEAYTILSCTSQDSESHPATAVKRPTATTYWQTEAPEKKAALELALAAPVQIQRIVIGNAGAAFVEILVGKSTSRPIDYQVLQPIKPLCTMSESKSGANRYSGYSFADKFERNVAKQTWDRVKIICTQPWNVGPLGLSFVIINPTTDVSHLLKPSASLSAPAPKPTTATTTTTTTPSAATSASTSKPASAAAKIAPSLPKPASNERAKEEKADESVPLNKLLAGVTFVISGIQNPQRADIRDKATKMGAKYQQNWDNRATHLICAFQDTPKYREVKGKGGIIVKPEWIVHSFAQKKRLPLTKYTFEKMKEDVEEEEAEEKQGHTGGGAPMEEEEEEEEEEGLLDRRKAKNRPPAPEAKEDDSDTEEMDELDLGPTLPIALPAEAEREGGDEDDDMLPTLPIARDYDDDVPTYKANVDKGKGKGKDDAEEEEEGTEEIDELDLLPTLPIFEYQQAKQTKGPPKAKSESDTADSANKKQQERKNDHEDVGEENEDEGYDLPTLAMDHAYSAKKSEARRVEDDEEGDTEEMEEEEEGDDLNATLPIPEYAEPTKKPKKPTPLASAPATATTKHAGKEEDEDSGTEEMDEVDLLPTLPIVAATTLTEAKSSSSLMGKRKREVSKEEEEEESSGTEPLSDVDAPLPTREDKLPAKGAAAKASQQPLAKKQKPEPTTAKPKDSEVLGKLFAVRPLPDFLDKVNVFFHGKSLDDDMRRLLQRYIVAYKGRVSPYLYEDVTHVVTTDDWGKDFERALKEHPGLVIARPEWVLECHIQQKRVNTTAYRLSP